MSEPLGAIIHDEDSDRLIELPEAMVLQPDGRVRLLKLRIARGLIRDVEQTRAEEEADG